MASAASPKSAATKKRRPRDSLSRAVIVEAAEKIAERDGLEGLTFGALGKELNAHSTSIYRHFKDKDDLVLELIDTLRAKSYGADLVSTGDWREDLKLISRLIHDHYMRYPGLAMQMAARTTRRPTEFHNVEFALDAMRRAGLDEGWLADLKGGPARWPAADYNHVISHVICVSPLRPRCTARGGGRNTIEARAYLMVGCWTRVAHSSA